jgi:hypothetical protein
MTFARQHSHHLASRSEYRPPPRFVYAAPNHHRGDDREPLDPPPVSFSRPFDVYHREAATHTRVSNTWLRNTLDLPNRQADPGSSALFSASQRPTVFQAGTPLGFEVFRAFPSPHATCNSSLQASLHAVSLTSASEHEPQLRGFERPASPYPIHTWFRRMSRPMLS